MLAAVWVVAGPPGAGKSSVARLLAGRLTPPGAVLDKDTVYGSFVAATLAAAGRPDGEREGPWYDVHVKLHEYAGLSATAREIRGSGCPVVVVAPYTAETHDAARWAGLVAGLGGEPVRLVWLRCDPAALRERLVARASPRDAAKLADYGGYLSAIRATEPPVVAHHEIDNSGPLGDLPDQVDRILAAQSPSTPPPPA